MTAGVLPFRSESECLAALPAAVKHLRDNGLVVHPTETVYGIGGAISDAALAALTRLKGERDGKVFLLLVSGEPMLAQIGLELTGPALALAKEHWPGPLTLVLPGDGTLTPYLRSRNGGVAVRWTSLPSLQRLIAAYGSPITSTSANTAGGTPSRSATQVKSIWGSAIENGELLLLDAGELRPSAPSTIVDCTERVPRVLRAGAIGVDKLLISVPDLLCDL